MTVMDGRSVILHTDVTELQRNDEIEWRFGPQNTLIAEVKRKNDKTYDGDDGTFKNKLKLSKQSGSLTISRITTDHSGLYELKSIRRGKTYYKRFRLTVTGE